MERERVKSVDIQCGYKISFKQGGIVRSVGALCICSIGRLVDHLTTSLRLCFCARRRPDDQGHAEAADGDAAGEQAGAAAASR